MKNDPELFGPQNHIYGIERKHTVHTKINKPSQFDSCHKVIMKTKNISKFNRFKTVQSTILQLSVLVTKVILVTDRDRDGAKCIQQISIVDELN